jgi:hypothetical protein
LLSFKEYSTEEEANLNVVFKLNFTTAGALPLFSTHTQPCLFFIILDNRSFLYFLVTLKSEEIDLWNPRGNIILESEVAFQEETWDRSIFSFYIIK